MISKKRGFLPGVFLSVAPLALLVTPVSAEPRFCASDTENADDARATDADYEAPSLQNGTSVFLKPCGQQDSSLCGTNRLLNNGESSSLTSFYGNQINPGIVRIYYTGDDEDVYGSTLSGESVLMNGAGRALDDFTFNPLNPLHLQRFRQDEFYRDALVTFFHEFGHIWQNQHKDAFTRSRPMRALSDSYDDPDCDRYGYYVIRSKRPVRFSMYTAEQQASMIGDYLTIVYAGPEFIGYRFRNVDEDGAVDRMMRIIERQFPGARTMRLSFEANRSVLDKQVAALPPLFNPLKMFSMSGDFPLKPDMDLPVLLPLERIADTAAKPQMQPEIVLKP